MLFFGVSFYKGKTRIRLDASAGNFIDNPVDEESVQSRHMAMQFMNSKFTISTWINFLDDLEKYASDNPVREEAYR
jgi:hypothetical protein